jgi:hypothetical protein
MIQVMMISFVNVLADPFRKHRFADETSTQTKAPPAGEAISLMYTIKHPYRQSVEAEDTSCTGLR